MAKRTVEIEDSLDDAVASAIDQVRDELISYLDQNPDTGSTPDIGNDLDYSGAIHEIVDGSVPIYTSEIDDTWYLYANKLEEAYENAGVGENPRENNGMAAIYYYIHEKVCEWYTNNAEDIFDEWQEKRDAAKADEWSEEILNEADDMLADACEQATDDNERKLVERVKEHVYQRYLAA